MAQFYTRYVPPAASIPDQATKLGETSTKRKRGGVTTTDGARQDRQRQKKEERKSEEEHHEERTFDSPSHDENYHRANGQRAPRDVLSKYSVSQAARARNDEAEIRVRKKKVSRGNRGSAQDTTQDAETPETTSEKNRQSRASSSEDDAPQKHSVVLRKYDRSKKLSGILDRTELQGKSHSEERPGHEVRSLVPIPQPDRPKADLRLPTFSTQAVWQTDAMVVDPNATSNFEDFDLSKHTLSNLRRHGLTEAFPLQATVIPELMRGVYSYTEDLCVSAATGSGKTLAYVVPIVEKLCRAPEPGLRAVIVVPTRELVKQVREACEICASGTKLNIVAALGGKTIQAERKALVEHVEVSNTDDSQRDLDAPPDRTTFNLEKFLQRPRTVKPGHIIRSRIKADILITTPGRLVKHLETTDGFHLDHVKWLVVDEADRLLGESYQEWLDTTMLALQSRRASERSDKILSHMRMELPPRVVRKILLSATMTRDISKLSGIDLRNPKLINLEPPKEEWTEINDTMGSDYKHPPNPTGRYSLPRLMQETAVTFKEGADKPLILLHLLEQLISEPTAIGSKDESDVSVDGSSEESSEESSEDVSSESSTDSDSDPEQESSSSSSASAGSSEDDSARVSSTSSRASIRGRERRAERRISAHQSKNSVTSPKTVRCLIFTRSTASASRLSRLISIVSPHLSSNIATLTRSTTSSAASRKILSSFRSGKTPILISTDRASRGIDIPGLEHVISYDVPGSALIYVHRVGRTARAGKAGNAWTLVEHREGRWFWNEIGGKSTQCVIERADKVKKLVVSPADYDHGLRENYENALQVLGAEVQGLES